MIEVVPDFSGKNTYTFIASTENEKKYLEDNVSKILDKFVSKYFKNNETTNIHTLKDFFLFCTDYKFCLERYYGHPVKKIGKLEIQDFTIIQKICTSELSFSANTQSRLKDFVNELYNNEEKQRSTHD